MPALARLMSDFDVSNRFRGVRATLAEWRARERQRRELSRLDSRLLRDIGAAEADVARELRKPFWRA